jgi:hypothetical protein
VALGLALLLAVPALALAQETDAELRDEIEALKKGQQDIQKQLAEIKKLLQARPQGRQGPNVKGMVFDIGDNLVKGPGSAKLTMIEFTDYQ